MSLKKLRKKELLKLQEKDVQDLILILAEIKAGSYY